MRRVAVASALFIWVLIVAPSAPGAAGDLTLVSTTSLGVVGNEDAQDASVSSDGMKVAFTSQASNLDPADTDNLDDIYVKDLATGVLTLASTSTAGTKGNSVSVVASISGDGTKVAFWSFSTNLDPADTDTVPDVYVKDLVTGALTLASTTSTGTKGNGDSVDPVLTSDGGAVAFTSRSTNLDPADLDTNADVYLKDLSTGTLDLVSTTSLGVKADNPCLHVTISSDGSRVGFVSYATNLDPTDTDTIADVYVKDAGSGALALASTSALGAKSDGNSVVPTLSDDGTKIAFYSKGANLDPNDADADEDVYVKNLLDGGLALASTRADGTKSDGVSYFSSLSGDGNVVSFVSSATNLDPADTDALADVYVKDLASGTLSLASITGAGVKADDNVLSSRDAISSDGTRVTFHTLANNLDPADTGFANDVYLKEVGGAQPVTVAIRIKKSGPTYTVSVLTDLDFDATTIDVSTVCFGDAEEPSQRDCTEVDGTGQIKDADRDGDLDMLLQFEVAQTGVDAGDTQACITGETTASLPFEGCGALKAR